MKTKHLIKLLQQSDPSGELECCVGNEDIISVYQEPAYYDGSLQVLIHKNPDPNMEEYYDVIGAKIVRSGSKVSINTHSIKWAMLEAYDSLKELPITFEGSNTEYYKDLVAKWKQELMDIYHDLALIHDKEK